MNSLDFRRYASTISTGKVVVPTKINNTNKKNNDENVSFSNILNDKLKNESVTFSSHAQSRAKERSINLSSENMDRLNEGLQIAKSKGLDQTLILMDKNAFIVSAKNNKVITTMGESDLVGNVITNIQGTVII